MRLKFIPDGWSHQTKYFAVSSPLAWFRCKLNLKISSATAVMVQFSVAILFFRWIGSRQLLKHPSAISRLPLLSHHLFYKLYFNPSTSTGSVSWPSRSTGFKTRDVPQFFFFSGSCWRCWDFKIPLLISQNIEERSLMMASSSTIGRQDAK